MYYSKEGLKIAIEINNPECKRDAYDVLSKVQYKLGAFNDAYNAIGKSKALGDSIVNNQTLNNAIQIEKNIQQISISLYMKIK